jgi:hypothetical protein
MNGKRYGVWAGLSVLGGFIVALVSLFAGLLAVFNEFNYVGAGLCFFASAFALGLLANATLRE